MGLGNAWAENLRRKSLCQGTEQIDPFSNEASIIIHKSYLSGINKNRIRAGASLSLAHSEQKGSLPGAQQRRKHYFLTYSNKACLCAIFHLSCWACAVYYQYWLLMPRSQLSPKCSAVAWVLSSKLSVSLQEMDTAVKLVIYFNGPDVREKFSHGRWGCLLILPLHTETDGIAFLPI